MKNKTKNNLLLFAIFSTNCLLAQFPDPDAPLPGDTNPTDAPLDGIHYVLIVMFFAMAIAFIMLQKKRLSKMYN